MAAEVDFGDLELFEAFDHPEESLPKPVHTRFKDGDGDEEDEDGVGDAGPRERLRQCEEAIERLRAENILPSRRRAAAPGRAVGAVPLGARAATPRGRNSGYICLAPDGGLRSGGSGCGSRPGGLGAGPSATRFRTRFPGHHRPGAGV
ncbi:unnamed protein product [Pipistrellus nathusii]|uniref:Uncharacterized protein n=1 Tax=Pipistrellus nathusii TaxID=59473 RepID=A0ABN9ZT66_PIPNA